MTEWRLFEGDELAEEREEFLLRRADCGDVDAERTLPPLCDWLSGGFLGRRGISAVDDGESCSSRCGAGEVNDGGGEAVGSGDVTVE